MSDEKNVDKETPEEAVAATPEGADGDVRAKMKEALDRKNQQSHAGQAHLDGHAKAGGTHGKAGGGREFRRKSGG